MRITKGSVPNQWKHSRKQQISNCALCALTLVLLCTGTESTAVADEITIEEIVVTARKREESLQDVPFSIAGRTEEALRKLGATTLEGVANTVTGFSMQNLGPGQSQPAIRGISAGQIVRDLPGVKEQVGVYLDESAISLSLFTPDIDLFDVNRVEVLRGPQGTLFGSGSLAGTVRYITNAPSFHDVAAFAEAGGSAVEGADFGGRIKAGINIPLSDAIAVRAVGFHERTAGFVDAVQPDQSIKEGVNQSERIGGRLAVLIQPSDRLSITPRIMYQRSDVGGFNRVDAFNILANPFTTTRPPTALGERQQFTQLAETLDDEFLLFDTTVEYDFSDLTLTSTSSYIDRDIRVIRDATALTASIVAQPTILDQPEAVFTLDAALDDVTGVEVFTQELRLSNNATDGMQWLIGAFYSDIQRDYAQSLFVDGFEALSGIDTNPAIGADNLANLHGEDVLFFSAIPYDVEQLAVFGEATWPLSDRLDLTLGARYFDFEESRELNFDALFAAETIAEPGTTSSDGISPRALLSYALSDDAQLNLQVAKGFRLGGINDPLNEPICSPEDLVTFGDRPSFDDEELWNYEVGAKTTFADGRGRFNVALFYADIKNLQAPLDAGTCSSRIVFNVPEAHTAGVELEFGMQVTESFDFGVSASLLEAEFDSTVTSTDATGISTPVGGIVKGNRLPTAPELQASANATYTWPAFGNWQGFAAGSVHYVGDRFTQPIDQAPGLDTVDLTITPIGAPSETTFVFDPELPSYAIANTRIGLRSDRYELALFVNNVTDEVARLSLDRERGGRARVGFHTNPPRTFGFNARVNF